MPVARAFQSRFGAFRSYSTRSFARASATVCHCMLLGVSGPPRQTLNPPIGQMLQQKER